VCDEPAATYERASDEHGHLGIAGATNRLVLGDRIRLVPGHCEPTVNLFDWYVCVRANRVEQTLAHHRKRRGLLALIAGRVGPALGTLLGMPAAIMQKRFSLLRANVG
jgi:hypothetical protein